MKLNVLCLFLILLFFTSLLFAKGKTDSANVVTQNNEWVLCITEFNASLSGDKTNISTIAARELAERFSAISYHTRISPEYAYYEDYAWTRARSAAAKSLAAKIEERARYIYQGEPDWKYRQNIKKADTDIGKLRAALEEVDGKAPLINTEPVFKLTSSNTGLVFPPAPAAGGEARFCNTQKADAFLSGSITDYHGRYFLVVKLYTLYDRAYIWEDSIIFSHNDLNDSLDELIKKLIIVLSGNRPAALAVKTEPEDTLVLVNRAFAGRGDTGLVEYPVGTVIVTASALNHESITLETELKSGELTEISIKLNPVEYTEAQVSGDTSGNIYHGALYIGKAPLTLRLPVSNYEYVELDAANGNRGSIVFQTPETADFSQSMLIKTGAPLRKGAVDKERRKYYWIWGTQWMTGIAAWVSYYSYIGARNAFLSSGNTNEKLYQDQVFLNYFSIGAIAAFGASSAYGIYQMIRYIVISSKDETKLPGNNSRTGRAK